MDIVHHIRSSTHFTCGPKKYDVSYVGRFNSADPEINCKLCLNILFPTDDQTDNDLVNHPAHYTQSDIEPIDVIKAWQLSFQIGSVLKYIMRAKHKGYELRDLQKAEWYLKREINDVITQEQKEKKCKA